MIVCHIVEISEDDIMTYQSNYLTTMSDDFEPLSFTNISGGAAPILASVIGVSPKTWWISASIDARSTPYGSSA